MLNKLSGLPIPFCKKVYRSIQAKAIIVNSEIDFGLIINPAIIPVREAIVRMKNVPVIFSVFDKPIRENIIKKAPSIRIVNINIIIKNCQLLVEWINTYSIIWV